MYENAYIKAVAVDFSRMRRQEPAITRTAHKLVCTVKRV